MATAQLRPLGIGEILDVAMKIVWRNAGTLVRVVIFVVLPVQIVSTIITLSSLPKGWSAGASPTGFPNGFTRPETGVRLTTSQVTTLSAGIGISTLLTLVAGLLASGACFRAITSAYLGEPTTWVDSLRFAGRRFLPLLWVSFLSFLFAGLGLIACVIPGIYLWIGFAVAVPVLLSEDARGTKALGRSRALVSGSWWRVLGVVVLGAILTSIVAYALVGLFYGLTTLGTGGTGVVVGIEKVFIGTISSAITTPFVAAFTAVLYFDLRVRKEGFDLQLLAQRIGVDPPAGYRPLPDAVVAPASQPPYWPPPPGWQPGAPAPPAPGPPPGANPPFWPPPPGWKPPGNDA